MTAAHGLLALLSEHQLQGSYDNLIQLILNCSFISIFLDYTFIHFVKRLRGGGVKENG